MVKDRNNIRAAMRALDAGAQAGLEALAEDALEAIDQGFERGTDPLGRAWAPLAPSTVRQKGHSDILVDEGEFRDSFRYESSSLRRGARVQIGTDSELAPYHEWGVPENNLPARPILQPTAIHIEEDLIGSVFARALSRSLSRRL